MTFFKTFTTSSKEQTTLKPLNSKWIATKKFDQIDGVKIKDNKTSKIHHSCRPSNVRNCTIVSRGDTILGLPKSYFEDKHIKVIEAIVNKIKKDKKI